MIYCRYCYRMLEDGTEICTACGKSQMGLKRFFDFFKKDSSKQEQPHVNQTIEIEVVASGSISPPLSPEEYSEMRQSEVDWFEQHYDFNSLACIKRIPARAGQRCPLTSGVTGMLYYYLRGKAYHHEKEGNMELAIACMSKSSELAILNFGNRIQKRELYPLVRLLARYGFVEEAIAEKDFVDSYCAEQNRIAQKERFQNVIEMGHRSNCDLLFMPAYKSACSECAKYQGRIYSISGKSKQFPKLPDFLFETGQIHPGCHHSLCLFYENINSSPLNHVLNSHPLKQPEYGQNIITFSNRPFEDDRTEDAKAFAKAAQNEQMADMLHQKQLDDTMIEREYEKGQTDIDFKWLQEHIPEKCPKSASGYRRMRKQYTKKYRILEQLAAELGKELF